MVNTIITKEAYENLKNTGIDFLAKAESLNFTPDELEALEIQDQIKDKDPNKLHGSSFAH